MSNRTFTDPDDAHTEWADVRMTDPQEGEWDLDALVIEGRIEHVDLRIRPDVLAGFFHCLLDELDDERASTILATVADRRGVQPDRPPDEE